MTERLTPAVECDTRWNRANILAIVGGGLLGLTLALRLAQRGYRVTLLEAADHVGGLADAWQLGDVTWDRHYHVTLLSDSHLRGILRRAGPRRPDAVGQDAHRLSRRWPAAFAVERVGSFCDSRRWG